jgi:hypothetical protein
MFRPLSEYEAKLITRLLEACGRNDLVGSLGSRFVTGMDDGRMGSIAFEPRGKRRFGVQIATLEFQDNDGVPVSAALNLDDAGDLYELDIWKTDFAPLNSLANTNV